MRRKKSYETKKKPAKKQNKEVIKNYKKSKNMLDFCGDVNIKLTCLKCKEVYFIRSHRPELYTDEIKKNYVCLNCRRRK